MARTLEKPVTPTMWSLAFAFESNRAAADCWVERYELAASDRRWATLFAAWLHGHLERISPEDVTAPWATRLIHDALTVIERLAPPGSANALNLEVPTWYWLPCAECGMAFTSTFRGGRFTRACGSCFEYERAAPDHPRGGLVQHKLGLYPKHRSGQSLGVTEYGTSVVCGHPDCLELVLVTRSDRDYCDEHARLHREQIRRLRAVRPPKHERFLFRRALGIDYVRYHWGPCAEETELLLEGRFARDEEELLALVQLAQVGTAPRDSNGRKVAAVVVEDTFRND